jgi:hypothetical protein
MRLREESRDTQSNEKGAGEVGTCDHSVGVCMCSYWNMRRKMKAALEKENSDD